MVRETALQRSGGGGLNVSEGAELDKPAPDSVQGL